MHTVDATICYGKNKKEAYQNGLKVFDGILKYRRELPDEFAVQDWYYPFCGKKGHNRFHHERWEPVIEGDSEKAKEIFDFLRIVEEREAKDEKWWYWFDEEMKDWVNSDRLWAERLYIPADNKYGYKVTKVDEALKEVKGKHFYIVAVDMHY